MSGRATRRLSELGRQAGARRAPFYVRRPISPALEATYPAEGWYWVPPEHTWAVYLGANEISAAVKLTRMIEEELRAQ